MTLRKPLTLMHEETQVPTSMVDGTSLRQPPKMVSHSSKRCRSDASFQACGGARSVETATSIVAITVSYPRRGAVETKLAGPHTASLYCAGCRRSAVVYTRPNPRNLSPSNAGDEGFHCQNVNSLRNRLRRTTESAIVYPPASGDSSGGQGGFVLTGTDTTAVDKTTGQDPASRPKGGPVIEIDNVTKRFADYVAVSEADFSIASGEFFSMLGPSGCGKTTTLRMIAGFETPTEGAIRLEGKDVSRVPPHKRNVNTVFQHYALFPHMTVWDNVAYGPRSMKKDKAEVKRRVDELIEIVRLTDFAKRKPAQLSGGQQQRVALARALVNYPSA